MEKIKHLLWLQYKILKNNFRQSKRRFVGVLFFFLVISWFSLSLYRLLISMPEKLGSELLFYCFLVIYFLVVLMPVFGFSFNESYDPSKLFIYPLSYQTIFISSVLTNFLDFSFLLFVPPLVAIIVAFSSGVLQGIVIFTGISLFLIHSFGLSQIIVGLLLKFLKSRKFRDISIIISSVMGVGLYLLIRIIGENMAGVLSLHISDYFGFLPPRFMANLIVSLQANHFLPVLYNFCLLLFLSIVTLFAGMYVVKESYYSLSGTQDQEVKQIKRRKEFRLPFSEEVNAIFWKDFKFLTREPQMKMVFIIGILFFFIWFFLPSKGGELASTGSFGFFFLASMIPYFFISFSSLNLFGLEGKAISVLLSSPCRRENIFIGKNLVFLFLGSFELLVLMIIAAFIIKSFAFFVIGFIYGIALFVVFASVGNVISVYFPSGVQFGTSKGRYASFTAAIVFIILGPVVGIPVVLSVVLPIILKMNFLLPFTVVVSLLYSVLVYYFILKVATNKLMEKETNIIEKCGY
ncbi:MAG: hypothetical protein KAT65_14240 [Methanophagales archaeon]|nr:hypothetical protein [Methanophagales archaeon]